MEEGRLLVVAYVDPRTGQPLGRDAGGVSVSRFTEDAELIPASSSLEIRRLGTSAEGRAYAELAVGRTVWRLGSEGLADCDGPRCAVVVRPSAFPVSDGSSLTFRSVKYLTDPLQLQVRESLGEHFTLTVPAVDGDRDGVLLGADCDDTDATCGIDCADADGDGVCATADCDDIDPLSRPAEDGRCLGIPAAEGTGGGISLAWDPVAGATSYSVDYGTSSGVYTQSVVVPTIQATLETLQDCTTYYIQVRAFDSSGEMVQPVGNLRRTDVRGWLATPRSGSNEVSGWSRPRIDSVSPASIVQGRQAIIEIQGANFLPGSVVEFWNRWLYLSPPAVLGCTRMQVPMTAETWATLGLFAPTVTTPDGVFGTGGDVFRVDFDRDRVDFDGNHRIDAHDLFQIGWSFGSREGDLRYEPTSDLDGDGWIDGVDLAYFIPWFHRYLP